MTIPSSLHAEVEHRFGELGGVTPIGGGSISAAERVETAGGPIFLKHGARAPAGMFAAEAAGLEWLRPRAAELRVPRVLAVEEGWLALEWLEPGSWRGESAALLGRGLAALHRSGCEGWGWERDGFIGTLTQENGGLPGWAAFWAERRLEPQLRLATEAGRRPGGAGEWERLLTELPGILAVAEEEGPSPLHGDLWSGNIHVTAGGEPALVDPAPYRGHREVDLAMSELFGGFPRDFLPAYCEVWPLAPGYAEVRRGVYQLYYLLVHVNLFGGGYREQAAGALRSVLAAV